VIEVNKIAVVVIALAVVLLVSPLIGTVFAGKGQIKQSFDFSYKEYPMYTDGPDSHASPKGSEGADQITFHGRGTTHDSPILEYTLAIGGVSIEAPFTKEGGCDYDFNSKTMMVIHRATETLTFGRYGTIVLSIIEKIDFSTMVSEGTFVGFGTDGFKDVKIVGKSSSMIVDFDYELGVPILGITHTGTIMGWPDLS
jgi:hypothetical protein